MCVCVCVCVCARCVYCVFPFVCVNEGERVLNGVNETVRARGGCACLCVRMCARARVCVCVCVCVYVCVCVKRKSDYINPFYQSKVHQFLNINNLNLFKQKLVG